VPSLPTLAKASDTPRLVSGLGHYEGIVDYGKIEIDKCGYGVVIVSP